MRSLFVGMGLLALSGAHAQAGLVEKSIHFVSGADRACNQNCLYVSVNEGPYQKLGCNKAQAGGPCKSLGGLRGSLKAPLHDDRCNHFRFQLISKSKDGGDWFRSFYSTDPHLIPGQGYIVLSRTPQRAEFWLNDNSDDDAKDFHGTVWVEAPFTFGVNKLIGASCP